MTAKTLPAVGEFGIPGIPSQIKIDSMTWGLTSDYDINLADTTQADSDGVWHAWEFPANTMVTDVWCWVKAAFTSGSINIGDSVDSDGWFSDTLLDPGTTSIVPNRASAVAGAYKFGKMYDSDDWVGIDIASTTPTAGNGVLAISYADNVITT